MAESPSTDALVARLRARSGPALEAAKDALRQAGEPGLEALERAAADGDPRLRARARQCLGELLRDRGLARLARGLRDRRLEIIEGLGAIDELLGHREAARVRGRIEAWSEAVRARMGGESGPGPAARALRAVLAGDAGLIGAEEDFHHVDHVSLSRTAATGRGLPLTLCALYAAVGRRVGVRAGLLPFPGHVLLGLGREADRLILDPFTGGRAVSREACAARLAALGAPSSPLWLQPATDRSMVLRQARNLAAALDRHGRGGLARRVATLVDGAA